MSEAVKIQSQDYWVKVVDMLQQNWALIDTDGDSFVVYFISDRSGVFDEIRFPSESDAEQGLHRNGFRKVVNDDGSVSFLIPPEPPFTKNIHPNGPIYSSGRFWNNE